jgi:cyclophilin family peptidyl-prolyl cis-trans isomerase
VAYFTGLVAAGHYDGTTFHRVIPDFMIQGGDPNTRDRDPRNDGQGGLEPVAPDEFSEISHLPGIVSLANRGGEGTAGTQFFIVLEPARPLDGSYTVFGRVVGGMDVVERIAAVERDVYGRWGPRDRPREDVVIESIRIEPARPAAPAPAAAQAQPGARDRARAEGAPGVDADSQGG